MTQFSSPQDPNFAAAPNAQQGVQPEAASLDPWAPRGQTQPATADTVPFAPGPHSDGSKHGFQTGSNQTGPSQTGPNQTGSNQTGAQQAGAQQAGAQQAGALPSSLAQLASFTPRHSTGSRWLGYVPFLAWLVHEQRPKQLVALGLGSGTAYFSLCQAAADLPPGNAAQPRLYGIDTAPQDASQSASFATLAPDAAQTAASGRADGAAAVDPAAAPDLPEALRRANAAYAPLSRLICADPLRAHRAFDPGTTDLLLVDLPLSAALLTHLAQDWLPLMSPRGVILLCGTQPGGDAPLAPETAAALRQLLARMPHLALPWAGGMVALMTGDLPPPALSQLAALAPEAPARHALIDLLRRAGAPLLQHAASEAAAHKVLALEAELMRRQDAAAQEIAALTRLAEARRSQADEALAAAEQQLGTLKAQFDQAQSQQAALEADLTELRSARLNDSRELAVFARLCEDHRQQANRAEAREAKLRQDLAEMSFHLQGTRAEVTALRASTSWRLTAPLRRVIQVLRPSRRG